MDIGQRSLEKHLVAVITDGSAVLGLGDIGPEAGMPVMEGKCVLFKEFAGVDAFPLCLKTHDVDELVRAIYLLSGSFGGINLEDIAAPRCFEVERRLKALCDIPVFHDDQHGTAVVVAAALINAFKLVGKRMEEAVCVINGAGSAGIAIALTNRRGVQGKLADALRGADVFVGVSAPNVVSPEMVASMARDAIVLAMANPTPEINPVLALKSGAKVVGTGRSDFDNQINNVLAFPGIFRGALDVRARDINDAMKTAASQAIASLVSEEELRPGYILPQAFDRRVGPAVARAVAQAAIDSGVARIPVLP